MLEHEPDWGLFKHPSVVSQLFQLSKHYDLIQQLLPTSIEDVADILALIRPQKRFLLKYYLEDQKKYRDELYRQDPDGSHSFKKAHAIAYALVVVLQLHLIKGGIKFDN